MLLRLFRMVIWLTRMIRLPWWLILLLPRILNKPSTILRLVTLIGKRRIGLVKKLAKGSRTKA